MTRTSKLTTLGLLATLAASAITPALADRASDQKNKNNTRNLAILGAAIGGYGLLSHNNTIALLGAAGAGLAGSQYEKDRKNESQDNHRYYYRNDNRNDNRYDNRNDNNWKNDRDQNWDRDHNQNWNQDQNWDRNHNQNWNKGRDQNWNDTRPQTWQNGNRNGWNR